MCIIFSFLFFSMPSLYHILKFLADVISIGRFESSGASKHGRKGHGSTHITLM
uniref:Uncharacterized protein n=1 Tax=Populus trichocarpa TaxID=3694 RepID=A9P8T2_POPTR|nr:unknown [Populus trichocarpa]